MTKQAEFREVHRNLASKDDSDHRNCYLAIDGRATLPELISHLEHVAPGKPLDAFSINFATVTWVDDATDEEKRQFEAWRIQAKKREQARVHKVAAAILDALDHTNNGEEIARVAIEALRSRDE